jgi:ectoine hydroxylase-related dioxygenase (phytanoyl-CoA dioxygenase family)
MLAPGQATTLVRSNDEVQLTDDQRQAYERDGFLVFAQLVNAAEVARLRALLSRIYQEQTGWDQGQQFDLAGNDAERDRPALPQILEPSRYAPELLSSPFRSLGFDIAHQLLGGERPETEMNVEHAILKPGLYGAQTPWHQDEAYWRMPNHDARALAMWMPLQDASVQNGCLWYLPGSHLGPIRRHRPIGGDVRVHGLETLDFDQERAIPVPMAAGSVVVHHVRCLHYAGANRTPAPRYAYTLAYMRPSVPARTTHDMPWLSTHKPASHERVAAAPASAS